MPLTQKARRRAGAMGKAIAKSGATGGKVARRLAGKPEIRPGAKMSKKAKRPQ